MRVTVTVTPAVCGGRGAGVVQRLALQQRPVALGVRLLARSRASFAAARLMCFWPPRHQAAKRGRDELWRGRAIVELLAKVTGE